MGSKEIVHFGKKFLFYDPEGHDIWWILCLPLLIKCHKQKAIDVVKLLQSCPIGIVIVSKNPSFGETHGPSSDVNPSDSI